MAGKRQKHPDLLAFTRGGRYRALEPVTGRTPPSPPPCPDRVTVAARGAWDALWESKLSAAFTDTDLPALYRWLWWYDQWIRTTAYIERHGPVTRGARGDQILHQRVRYLRICEASLLKLEESFGMTPLARLRLGITFSEARSAVDRLKTPMEPKLVNAGSDPRFLLRSDPRPATHEPKGEGARNPDSFPNPRPGAPHPGSRTKLRRFRDDTKFRKDFA